jgi:hypothetical protein
MSVPSSEATRPETLPSTRIIPRKLISPESALVPPTKPPTAPSLTARASDSLSDTAREVCVCASTCARCC